MNNQTSFTLATLQQTPLADLHAAEVANLRCEHRENPLGVDEAKPRLSWMMKSERRGELQTAYQVLVASSEELLRKDNGDLWDSGKVDSDRSLVIPYSGKPLLSGQRVWWKVRVWDKDGLAGEYSKPDWWEMGLLLQSDWKGKWICANRPLPQTEADLYAEAPAPLLRKGFNVERKIRNARAYVCGLGYYQLRINGSTVGDHVLDPGWTSYGKRVLYSTYDVTDFLQRGGNAVGVTLGNGWYNPLPLRMWGHLKLREHLTVGPPRCIVQLKIEYVDGTVAQVVSDETWRAAEGPIRKNSVYLGEVYDARKEVPGWDRPGFDDAAWHPVALASGTVGELRAQAQPPIRVTDRFSAVNVTEPQPGVFIYDMGVNFSGWASFCFKVPAGTEIVMRYGELLYPDGKLNPMTSVCGQIKQTKKNKEGVEESVGGPGAPPVAWQSDTYIATGDGEELYTPRFTFHGFRYVEVTGLGKALPLTAVTGLRLNSDVADVGSFECSNERFNRIQQMCRRTFLANLFSVQSDCPHRERMGYGGDIVATSEALILNFDMATFYAKAVQDWADSAKTNGMLTDTAPFMGIDYCGVGWAMAHPLLLMQLHRYYGNERLIAEQYEVAKRWLLLVAEQNPDGVVKAGLSDHESLKPVAVAPMVTPLYYQSARMLAEMARVLKRVDEAKQLDALAEKSLAAYQQQFLDMATGKAGPGTQGSQAFALYFDLVPAAARQKALDTLVENIMGENKGHLSTGIMGTKFMLDALSREGRADIAYGIVNQADFPGWGWMLENGATTLWEHWQFSDNTFSHSHPMFGSVSQWFISWLGGIQAAPGAVGFDRAVIRPQLVGDLRWVKSSYASCRGKIVSNWHREAGRVTLEVEIPVGVTAEVWIPAGKEDGVTEGGMPVKTANGVKFLRLENGAAVYEVGSGVYRFQSTTTLV